MSDKVNKTRDSGIELLRIIAILMVIGIHTFLYGNYYECAVSAGGFVELCSSGLKLLFRPAVNIFILITGYFMVKMRFDLKKAYTRVLKIYSSVLFYSVVLSLITILAGSKFYTIDGETDSVLIIVLKMIFPVLSQQWYFITDYILLCLLAPFVNIVLQNIKKKDYHVLIIVTTFIMSIWFLLSDLRIMDQVVRTYGFGDIQQGKNVFSFVYLYIIGGYIRLHSKKNDRPKLVYILGFFGCLLINGLLATRLQGVLELGEMVTLYTNPFVILMAVCLVMYFKDLHFQSKIVNTLASTTIGVYAIHEFKYIRELLWNMFDFRKVDCSNMFLDLVYIISIGVMVFGACAAIDLLRQRLFKLFEKKGGN
ncbi:MAG: acyltransferase [Lachnospiraceae bacterium]|nr:acyltransferase [Lachnospiraceae bacterium]